MSRDILFVSRWTIRPQPCSNECTIASETQLFQKDYINFWKYFYSHLSIVASQMDVVHTHVLTKILCTEQKSSGLLYLEAFNLFPSTFIRNAKYVCWSESRESKNIVYSMGLHRHEADIGKHKYKGKQTKDRLWGLSWFGQQGAKMVIALVTTGELRIFGIEIYNNSSLMGRKSFKKSGGICRFTM